MTYTKVIKIVRLVKLWRRSIAQQFELDAGFKALEDARESEWRAQKLSGSLAGTVWRVATRNRTHRATFFTLATTSGPPRVSSSYSDGANSMLGRVGVSLGV